MLVGTPWEKTGHPILIPGSMGDTSYVLYAAQGAANSLYSVNHGCGRRHSRNAMRDLLTQSAANKEMKNLGVMVNAGGDVPIDESPGAYKSSKDVIESVVSAGLATVAYTLTPLVSIKGTD
jgi:tRNA-splicing ligase RtcB